MCQPCCPHSRMTSCRIPIRVQLPNPQYPLPARHEPAMSTNTTHAQFPFFSKLPKELQLHVWQLCFTERRVIPIFCNPATKICALVRFLDPRGPPDREMHHIKPLPSLISTPYACKDVLAIAKSLYKAIRIKAANGRALNLPYNPYHDVLFFKTCLTSALHWHRCVAAFAEIYPVAAGCVKVIALERLGNLHDFLPAVREFSNLRELVIVLPELAHALNTQDWQDASQFPELDPRCLYLGIRMGKTDNVEQLSRRLEALLITGFEDLKRKRWQDWNFPSVRVVEHWQDIFED